MAIITTPVTEPSQIQSLVGVSTNNYADIFTMGVIKMWAKYKPVRYNATGVLTEAQRKAAGYGVSATKYDVDASGVPATMLDNAMAGNTGWVYNRPRGLSYNEWFRGWDWVGYNTEAVCPFYFENASITGQLKIRVGQVASLPTNNMAVTDITDIIGLDDPSMSGYGFIIRSGSNVRHIDAISSDGKTMNYPLNTDHEVILTEVTGTYEVCVYIRDYNRGNVVLLPLSGMTITVAKPQAVVKITAGFDDLSLSKPTFSFTITGNSSTTVTAGTATLRLYNSAEKEFEIFNYDIPALAYNATHSGSEKLELNQEVASWTFTYKGVTISG